MSIQPIAEDIFDNDVAESRRNGGHHAGQGGGHRGGNTKGYRLGINRGSHGRHVCGGRKRRSIEDTDGYGNISNINYPIAMMDTLIRTPQLWLIWRL